MVEGTLDKMSKCSKQNGLRVDVNLLRPPSDLRRLLAKIDEYSESHRAVGLPDDLLNILKDDLDYEAALTSDRS